jgi:hypothetical protein
MAMTKYAKWRWELLVQMGVKTPFEKSMRWMRLEDMVPTMTALACFQKDQSWSVFLAFDDEDAMAKIYKIQ